MGNNMMPNIYTCNIDTKTLDHITDRVKMFARVQATELFIQQTILNNKVVHPLIADEPKHYNTHKKKLYFKNCNNKCRKMRINQPVKKGQTVRYVACKNC